MGVQVVNKQIITDQQISTQRVTATVTTEWKIFSGYSVNTAACCQLPHMAAEPAFILSAGAQRNEISG